MKRLAMRSLRQLATFAYMLAPLAAKSAIVLQSINADGLDNYFIGESVTQDLNFPIEEATIDNNLAQALYNMPHITSHYENQGKGFNDFADEYFGTSFFDYNISPTGNISTG